MPSTNTDLLNDEQSLICDCESKSELARIECFICNYNNYFEVDKSKQIVFSRNISKLSQIDIYSKNVSSKDCYLSNIAEISIKNRFITNFCSNHPLFRELLVNNNFQHKINKNVIDIYNKI